MQIYLPIADLPVNIFLILAMGAAVGFVSGMFGIGGGFLMTPLLIFIGIPPAVSVATQSNQLVAASVSGVIAHWRRKNVDFKLGTVMLAGGALGSAIGVALFAQLKALGQIDLVISLTYVLFLGVVAALMMITLKFPVSSCGLTATENWSIASIEPAWRADAIVDSSA